MIVAAPKLADMFVPEMPDDLAAAPCAALEPFEGGTIPLTSAAAGTYTIRADVVFSTNNIFALHQAALRGIGYTVVPRWFVEADLAKGTLRDVLPHWRAPELAINVAFLPSRRQTVRLRAFVDHIAKAILQIPGVVGVSLP